MKISTNSWFYIKIVNKNFKNFSFKLLSTFPNTIQQRCVVHMIRNSVKYVNYKYLKTFTADLKLIYTSKKDTKNYKN